MEYFLGIDIGTTSVKSVAFSAGGKTLCEFAISYPIHHPYPDWSEQDPQEITTALINTVENILQELSPFVPRLCSFSSAMHSLIAVDENNMAISPSIIWADNRASEYAAKIHSANRAQDYYTRTGLPVHAMSLFCKLLWMRDHQPEIFGRARKFVGIKEWVFYKLFGEWVIDVSAANATGLMNAESLRWDEGILKDCGIQADQLSEIVPIKHSFSSARLFPVLKNIPFVIGGSDGAMANLGATEEPGSMVITVGTSSAARIIVGERLLDAQMRTFCYYLRDHQWLVGGASNNGGIVLQWLQEKFIQSEKTVTAFLQQAADVKPGAGGLIFLPYLLGERSPIWNAEARGVLFGLTINHGQAEMVRAAMESVIYCLYDISRSILEKTEIRNIYATGGFARNETWLQILSDVFNLPVKCSETVENSAWGAAKCGMQALQIPLSVEAGSPKIFSPDSDRHLVYARSFEKFRRLYESVRAEYPHF